MAADVVTPATLWVDLAPQWSAAQIPPDARDRTRRVVRVVEDCGAHIHGYSFWQQYADGRWTGMARRNGGTSVQISRANFLRRFEPAEAVPDGPAAVAADARQQAARDVRTFALTTDLTGFDAQVVAEMCALVAEGRFRPFATSGTTGTDSAS